MSDKIIFKTNWVQVNETEKGFQFLERKGKDSVAVFLVRHSILGSIKFETLVRYQPLPISNNDDSLFPCPITGGIEVGESPYRCALREVEEEAGYVLSELRELGSYIVGTQTNETVWMYWLNIDDITPEKIRGDGTFHESISINKWESIFNLKNYPYSACQIGYYKLRQKLGL